MNTCISRWARWLAVPFVALLCQAVYAVQPVVVEVQRDAGGDDAAAEFLTLYRGSYALVIGIDDYHNGWPRLSNAVKDAKLVARGLEQQGYAVDLRLNLDSKDLQETLRNFFIVKGANPEARLLLWFAGHGETIKGEGFLIAADTPVQNDPGFKLTAIHMRDFGSWVRLAESKHVLSVFDACFAGTVFTTQRGAPPPAITRATTYPVRQFITSGDADQLVLDNGSFRELFLRALNNEEVADLNGDGYLTASELGYYLSDRITNLTQAQQTPRYGKLRDKDFDRGDFVLAVLRAQEELLERSAEVQAMETENLLWQSVQKIDTVEAYRMYLERFPRGMYASLAALQIERLQQAASASRTHRATPQPSWRLVQTELTRYTSTDTFLYARPDDSTSELARVAAGTALEVMAEVRGRPQAWFQVRWRNGTAFVPTHGLLKEPPVIRKSMAELIEEARAIKSAAGDGSLAEQKLAHCKKQCSGMMYFRMDSSDEQRARQRCGLATAQGGDYESCMDKALQTWREAKRSKCEQRCEY